MADAPLLRRTAGAARSQGHRPPHASGSGRPRAERCSSPVSPRLSADGARIMTRPISTALVVEKSAYRPKRIWLKPARLMRLRCLTSRVLDATCPTSPSRPVSWPGCTAAPCGSSRVRCEIRQAAVSRLRLRLNRCFCRRRCWSQVPQSVSCDGFLAEHHPEAER